MLSKDVMKIGVDIGYGFSKVVDGKIQGMFPSKIGPAKTLNFSLREDSEKTGEVVEWKGKRFFVGDKARHCDLTYTLRTREWIESDMYAGLLLSALLRSLKGHGEGKKEAIIVSGLPVDYMSDKSNAEAKIAEVCASLSIHLLQCKIIPQPYGTFFDVVYDENGYFRENHETITINDLRVKRLGVVDVGFHTTDYIMILDSKHNIEPASGSVPTGAYEIYEAATRELKNVFKRDNISTEEAEEAVRSGTFKVSGKIQDITVLVTTILTEIGEKLSGLIRSNWAKQGEIDTVLLTGGGANLLKSHMSSIAHSVIVAENAQRANANGYYKRSVILADQMVR